MQRYLLLGLAWGLLPATRLWALATTVQVCADYQDNLTAGGIPEDTFEDAALRGLVEITSIHPLGDNLLATWGGSLGHTQWQRYDRFSESTATFDLAVRHRFGLGRTAPQVTLATRTGYLESGWDGGDAITSAIALTYSRWVSPTLQPSLSIVRDQRFADDSFLSRLGVTAQAALQWNLGERLGVHFDVRYRRGTVLSYGVIPVYWRNFSPYLATVPARREPGFGVDVASYPIRADTLGGGLTLQWAIGDRTTLLLGTDLSRTERDGLVYQNTLWSSGWIYRF